MFGHPFHAQAPITGSPCLSGKPAKFHKQATLAAPPPRFHNLVELWNPCGKDYILFILVSHDLAEQSTYSRCLINFWEEGFMFYLSLFFLIFSFLLKYSWFTIFQVYSKVIQFFIYTYIYHLYIYIYNWISDSSHYRLLQDIKYSSLCYTEVLLPYIQ